MSTRTDPELVCNLSCTMKIAPLVNILQFVGFTIRRCIECWRRSVLNIGKPGPLRDHNLITLLHNISAKTLQHHSIQLRGKKCHLAMSEVTYLGHVFSDSGMAPDRCKVNPVLDWAAPTDVTTVCRFLGLVSYYRRYTHQFAAIAAPLEQLTAKKPSSWWKPRS